MNLLQLPEESPPYPHRRTARPALFLRLIAAVLLGFLMGNIFMLSSAAQRIDQLMLENEALTGRIQKLQELVHSLEQDARARSVLRIEEVTVTVEGVDLPATRQQLERRLDQLADTLRGTSVEEINPVVIVQIFNGRILPTDEGHFQVALQWIVIGPRTRIHLKSSAVTADE